MIDGAPAGPQLPDERSLGDSMAPDEPIDGALTTTVAHSPLGSARKRRPAPGLFEAALWIIGLAVTQIFGLMLALGLVTLSLVLPGGGLQAADVAQSLKNPVFLSELQTTAYAYVFALGQLIFVAMMLLAVRLRLGRRQRQLLGVKPLLPGHAVLVVLLVLPVSMLSREAYDWFSTQVWEPLKAFRPELADLEGLSSMEMLSELVTTSPMWVLLLAMAVAPAVGEELVFRGVIGRGLLARWGMLAGVLLTSVMFAAMHMHPAHVVGVIPLGLAMHFVYIATRSFWAPVLYHLLNNTMAVLSAKFLLDTSAAAAGTELGLDPATVRVGWVLASISCAAAIALRLWRTRVEYRLPDGALWSPGYDTVEAPPAEAGAYRTTAGSQDWSLALVVASILVFVTAFIVAAPGV